MDIEKLTKANSIRFDMDRTERMLNRISDNDKVVEITFNNGGYSRSSTQSDYLSDEEVETLKDSITERIRERAAARLDELQKEFNKL